MRKLPRRKCNICGAQCKQSTTTFCSIKCRTVWQKGKRFGGPKLRVLPRSCAFCNKVFAPTGYKDNAKYCSKHCMGKARAEFCAELGRKIRGKKLSKEVKRKLSIAASKRNAGNQYTKGKGGTRSDLGHYVRSKWEANIARVLKYLYSTYEYEPDTFPLNAGERFYCYTPDFRLKTSTGYRYIEVKGYWDEKSKIKKKLFAQQYPNIEITYIDHKEYLRWKNDYKDKVKNWED